MSRAGEVTARDRFRGCLLGLAAGDALGTTLEFTPPGSVEPIDDMVGGGPFGLRPGEWTDDTSMALCLATSLVERSGFDAADQMRRYVRWWRAGYLSSTGHCFDIGVTVRAALSRFEQEGEPYAGSSDREAIAADAVASPSGACVRALRRYNAARRPGRPPRRRRLVREQAHTPG